MRVGGTLAAGVRTPLREFELKLDVRAAPGVPLALVGRSGSGKTSMLRAIAGLLSPQEGRVELGGSVWLDTERRVDLAPERRGCGFLFQDYALFPRMSAWRNVAYGIGGARRERRGAALAMLERFGVAALADARPTTMSGGERQRVALARALAARPPVLLLDEPLSALDSTTRREAIGELRAVFAESATPVVLVTHSFEEAAVLAGELVVIDAGREIQRGGAAAISAAPASAFVADFAGAVVLRGEARAEGDLTAVRLPGGGEAWSADRARGPVSLSVFPWEISIEAADVAATGGQGAPDAVAAGAGRAPIDSRLNRLACEVTAVTAIGSRTRVGLAAPEPLVAEVTGASAARLDLRPGARVVAVWKATATRLIPD
ncbi:MAG TPA: ATP-binding cassette domain-containing protein [Solirubrobacterales bacterium]|nr:ATP-binding cassette domain-containing protein [Solirubrobacterales bacterium]